MNELDDTLAQLFAREEPDASGDEFVAAVRRRIARERLKARCIQVVLCAAVASAAAALVVLAPEAVLYPVQRAHRLLSSPIGAAAGLIGAIGLAWWSRFGEV